MFDWFTMNQRRRYDNVQHVLVNNIPLCRQDLSLDEQLLFAHWRVKSVQQVKPTQEHKGYGIVNVLSGNSEIRLPMAQKIKHSLVNIMRVDSAKSEVWFCVFVSQVKREIKEGLRAATCGHHLAGEAAAAPRCPSAACQECRPAWRSRWSGRWCGAGPGAAGCWASTAASPGPAAKEPPCCCPARPPPATEGSAPGPWGPGPAWRLDSQFQLDERKKWISADIELVHSI